MLFHRRVWYRVLSLRYARIRRSASSSPLGYLCAKFRFCRALHCCLARGENLRTQSISHLDTYSPSLFDVPGTEAFASEFYFIANRRTA